MRGGAALDLLRCYSDLAVTQRLNQADLARRGASRGVLEWTAEPSSCGALILLVLGAGAMYSSRVPRGGRGTDAFVIFVFGLQIGPERGNAVSHK